MKPEPVPPPIFVRVLIETTDGRTRAAIPATESGALSITLEEETKFACLNNVPPVAVTPKNPPTLPASSATKRTVPRVFFLEFELSHHGGAT